jgi:molybdopterin converting factor small subunit
MTVTVQLFARGRDLAGRDAVSVVLPDGATVAMLRRQLAEDVPALAGLMARSVFAVSGEFADDGHVIPPDAEVALIPPVSGG